MNIKAHEKLVQEFLTSQEAKEYNPITYLIETSEKTNIPNIYRNPFSPFQFIQNKKLIIDIFGPSGAGKDTITRLSDQTIVDITIATNRPKREEEPASAYIWMREKRSSETDEKYFKNLISEYQLVSYAVENGILYGIPKSEIERVKDAKIITVRMSARSINILRENLQDEFNIVTLMVVPDSFESLIPSIVKRGNVEKRLQEAVENMKLGKKYANYFLLNKHIPGSEKDRLNAKLAGINSFQEFVYSQIDIINQ